MIWISVTFLACFQIYINVCCLNNCCYQNNVIRRKRLGYAKKACLQLKDTSIEMIYGGTFQSCLPSWLYLSLNSVMLILISYWKHADSTVCNFFSLHRKDCVTLKSIKTRISFINVAWDKLSIYMYYHKQPVYSFVHVRPERCLLDAFLS